MKKIIYIIVFVLLISSVYGTADWCDDVIASYTFDTDATDYKWVWNGTVNGAVHNTSECYLGGGCYSFDGNSFINVSADATFNRRNNYTFIAWIYRQDLSVSGSIIDRRNGDTSSSCYDWNLYHGGTSANWYKVNNYNGNAALCGNAIPLKSWTMVSVTMNTSNEVAFFWNDSASCYDDT